MIYSSRTVKGIPVTLYLTVTLSLLRIDGRNTTAQVEAAIKKLRTLLDNWLATLPDDTYLDTVMWQKHYADEWIKSTKNQGQYSPDCSYIDEILSIDLSVGYIDIVISPILKLRPETRLGQYVRLIYCVDYELNDEMRLYENSTNHNSSRNIVWESQVKDPGSYHIDTDIFYDKTVQYYAEYVRQSGEVILSTKHYHERPSWIWCMRDKLRDRPLSKIFLPGTHDSGAYTTPQWWRNHFYVSKIYHSYVFNQEDTVFSQLMQGSRSLDLRIAKYVNSTSIFYVNHNDFRIHPLEDVLVQIVAFIGINPYEIIVLDFHRFQTGFDHESDHEEFSEYLRTKLGDVLYTHPNLSQPWQVTPDDIWQTPGRIIAACNYEKMNSDGLYPRVKHVWGNKDKLDHLVNYMAGTLPDKCNEETTKRMSCAMVELTPKALGIVVNKYNGLRKLASETNSLITVNFVMGSWGNAIQAAAVDFIASSGIVTAAILQNSARTKEGHPCH